MKFLLHMYVTLWSIVNDVDPSLFGVPLIIPASDIRTQLGLSSGITNILLLVREYRMSLVGEVLSPWSTVAHSIPNSKAIIMNTKSVMNSLYIKLPTRRVKEGFCSVCWVFLSGLHSCHM